MKRVTFALGLAGVAAAVVVGVLQTRSSERATATVARPLSVAEVTRPIADAPPALRTLRERFNELAGGGAKAFDAQLRALRGHPVVVNLWASWCDPCRFELPFLQRAAVQRGATVAFLGVNVDDSREAALAFGRRYPMPYPSFFDERGRLAARLRARGLPATAFYDKAGRLEIVRQGVFPSERTLRAALDRYARP